MDDLSIILYITGGIALLALAWLFISLARAVSGVQDLMREVQRDLRTAISTIDEVKANVLPILSNVTKITGNVSEITGNVNSITGGVQKQMIGVHETIDDALNVVRGSLDDLERLKDEIISAIEGPVRIIRDTTGGATSTASKVIKTVWKIANAFRGNGKR